MRREICKIIRRDATHEITRPEHRHDEYEYGIVKDNKSWPNHYRGLDPTIFIVLFRMSVFIVVCVQGRSNVVIWPLSI